MRRLRPSLALVLLTILAASPALAIESGRCDNFGGMAAHLMQARQDGASPEVLKQQTLDELPDSGTRDELLEMIDGAWETPLYDDHNTQEMASEAYRLKWTERCKANMATFCAGVLKGARVLWELRQKDAPYEKIYQTALESKLSEGDLEILKDAYRHPVYPQGPAAQSAQQAFLSKWQAICLATR